MRLVFVHADAAGFETSAGSRASGDTDLWQRSAEIPEPCLVVFATVEDGDQRDEGALVANAANEITAIATQLGVDQIIVAPSAHLSSTPAGSSVVPEIIAAIGKQVETALEETAVTCVPADDKTSVEIAAKGHPHARQSTRVDPLREDDEHSDEREWTVLFPDGTTQAPGAVTTDKRPVNRTMQELLDQAAATDTDGRVTGEDKTADELPGQEGFLRDVIAEHARTTVTDTGAIPVETGGAAGSRHRQRVRPASGLPRTLPATVGSILAATGDSEQGRRCYRLATAPRDDKDSETRPRRTTPELWAQTGDLEAASAEFQQQVRLLDRLTGDLGLSSVPVLRVSQQGWDRHREWVAAVVAGLDEPVLVEQGGEPSDPWDIELTRVSLIDGQPIRLGSVGVAFRGLAGLDATGLPETKSAESGPLVCAALLCSVESAVSVTVGRARERDPPQLPVWLAPEEIRLVPTDPAAYTDTCETIADEIEAGGVGIRVGIDARERSVGERLDAAASALVPYVAVVGRPEADGAPLSVTDRAARTERDLTPAALSERVLDDLDGWPQKSRYQPRQVA
jgi:threonyl-tRNA synthetase